MSADDFAPLRVLAETPAMAIWPTERVLLARLLREHAEQRKALDDLTEAAVDVRSRVGCADHSCLFAKPRGMGTNGGCRCNRKPGVMESFARLLARLRALSPDTDTTPTEK